MNRCIHQEGCEADSVERSFPQALSLEQCKAYGLRIFCRTLRIFSRMMGRWNDGGLLVERGQHVNLPQDMHSQSTWIW